MPRRSTSAPSSPPPWALAAALLLGLSLEAKAVEVGDPETRVLSELGEPSMKMDAGSQGVIWAYGRGDVIIRNGKVIKVDLISQEAAEHKASVEAGDRARILRWKAYKDSRMAVLFNSLCPQEDAEKSGIRISDVSIRPEYVEVPVYNYIEYEVGYSSSGGDSMQSVGGGGGMAPGGQAPTVRRRVPPFTESRYVGAKVTWTVTKPLGYQFNPVAYLVNFFDRTRGDGFYVTVPIGQIEGLRKENDWTLSKLSVVISLKPGSRVERAFAESDGLVLVPAAKGAGGDHVAMDCEGKNWLPDSREPSR